MRALRCLLLSAGLIAITLAACTVVAAEDTAPSAPQQLTALSGNSFVHLSWKAPSYLGPGVITYHLYRNGTEIWTGPDRSFTDISVVNGTSYSYVVAAQNSVGTGPNSFPVTGNPVDAITVPSPPRNFTADVIDGVVYLEWTAPFYGGPMSEDIGYHLYRDGTEIWYTAAPWSEYPLWYYDMEVVKGTTHTYNVIAEDIVGAGPSSKSISVTPQGFPDAPWDLKASLGSKSVILNWKAGNYTGPGTITYHVYRNELPLWDGTTLTFTDTDVLDDTLYVYQVAAENEYGWSEFSNAVQAIFIVTTPPPGPPVGLQGIAGDGTVALNWSEPLEPNVLPVLSYNIYRGTSSGSKTLIANVEDGLTYFNTGLLNDQTYFYQVSAVNLVGEGQRSIEITVRPYTVPSAPLGLSAEVGNAQVNLTWSAPAYVGVPDITYHLFRDGTEIWSGPDRNHTDTGVIKGFEYSYSVAAENPVGWGPNGSSVSAMPYGVPDAPSSLTIVPGNGMLTISWQPGAYAGPGDLTYHLYRDGSEVAIGNMLSFMDEGLVNGRSYAYEVASNNSVGWSVRSDAVFGTPRGAPSAPTDLAAAPGDGLVDLSWSPPDYDPGPLTYHLYRDGVQIWSGRSLAHRDSGLVNNVTYSYKIAAENNVGWSANSTAVAAKPLAVVLVPPSPPQSLNATSGDGKITLTWQPPEDNGSSAITGYQIFRSTSSDLLLVLANVTETSYVDKDIVLGQSYHYKVRALSGAGESELSEEIVITASSITVPGAPVQSGARAVNDHVAVVYWQSPSDDGGSPIDYYLIYQDGVFVDYVEEFSTYIFDLDPGQFYNFTISAHNSKGEGQQSEMVQVQIYVPIIGTIVADQDVPLSDLNISLETGMWISVLSNGVFHLYALPGEHVLTIGGPDMDEKVMEITVGPNGTDLGIISIEDDSMDIRSIALITGAVAAIVVALMVAVRFIRKRP